MFARISIFWACVLTTGLGSAGAIEASLDVSPPVGWHEAKGRQLSREILISLRGPAGSSFMIARMPKEDIDGDARTSAFLLQALDKLKSGSRIAYRTYGRIETRKYPNGVNVRFIRATAAKAPMLVIAAVSAGGFPYFATLSSNSSDSLMPYFFGGLRLNGREMPIREGGVVVSADGQMSLALGGGLRSRELRPQEKAQGYVLAISGSDSELLILKSRDDSASPKNRSANVRATVASAIAVPLDGVSAARRVATAAGPVGVYAWAQPAQSPRGRYAAALLPWSYWEYEAFAQGPLADELLVGTFAALKLGPNAVAKLVEATPGIEAPDAVASPLALWAVGIAGLIILAFAAWRHQGKNANLPR